MSDRIDLTRWNRAGLSSFRYVDGNAVEYLEMLRQQLVRQFADPKTGLCEWLDPADETPVNEATVDKETLIQRQQRLGRRRKRILDSYHQDRRDLVWEITRTFARACHTLTEHVDAYANEGYLGTATQWDNVRRLVEMLDYHPAPPASASTPLLLEAKEGLSGVVKKGWQVKYKPPEGGEPVIFETLEDIQVDDALNELRLEGWNSSPEVFDPFNIADSAWPLPADIDVSAGELALLVSNNVSKDNQGVEYVEVSSIDRVDRGKEDDVGSLSLAHGARGVSWIKGRTTLLLSPKDVQVPHLNGADVIQLAEAHNLSSGDVIVWQHSSIWHFDQVLESDALSLRLQQGKVLPDVETEIFKAFSILRPVGDFIFPQPSEVVFWWNGAAFVSLNAGTDYEIVQPVPGNSSYGEIVNLRISEIFLLLPNAQAAGVIASVEPGQYLFDGGAGDLSSGQWVVAEAESGLKALKIMKISEFENTFSVVFSAGSRLIRSAQLLPQRQSMDIQGIGEIYADGLKRSGIDTVQKIADMEPENTFVTLTNGLNPLRVTITQLWDFKTRAKMILDTHIDGVRFGKLKDMGLLSIVHKSNSELIQLTGQPLGEVAFLKDRLRQLQITFDEDAFKTIKLAELIVGNKDSVVGAGHFEGRIRRIYGPFAHTLFPLGYDRNRTTVPSAANQWLQLSSQTPATALAQLQPQRRLLLQHEDGSGESMAVEVDKLDGRKLYLSESPDKLDAFTIGDLVLRANVVLAGHGEEKPGKILGSGSAMQSNQQFRLEVEGVAFTADETKSSGVAAAIDISVDKQIWQQVSSLKDSAPDDAHYSIRMTEEGYVKLLFGDGEHGRRLPTGKNNVRVLYRVGSGLAGNVAAGGLEKPVSPHPLIKAVLQPLQAAGGGDMESVNSLRENAPSTLLALERAVSLSDFSHLAAAQSSVWQAAAYSEVMHAGRMHMVKVVIVPAGGVSSEVVKKDMKKFLQKHALPDISVDVLDFNAVLFDLDVTIRVKSDEFITDEVEMAVVAALSDHFTLKNRRLGQHLYLSDVYKIVEGIQGVENSICLLNGDKSLRVIKVDNERSIVYLDTNAVKSPSTLTVAYEEYQL